MYNLYDYQKEAVEYHLEKKHSLNAFYMGLGKSLVAIDFVRRIGRRATIVCPAYLKKTWQDEIAKFTEDDHLFNVCSYSATAKLKEHNSIIVLDEAHYIKNPSTKRSKRILEIAKNNPPEYLLMMTGTPAKNDVSEVYNLIRLRHALSPVHDFRFSNINHFRNYFMNKKYVKMGANSFYKYSGYKNIDQLKYFTNQFMLRKKLGDVKLPDMVNKKIVGNSTKFKQEMNELFHDQDDKAFMTVKKEVAVASCSSTLDLIDSFPLDEQVVIFTDHVSSAEKIAEALDVPYIHGGIPMSARERAFDLFKEGKLKYLVATYKTASTGLTLTNCSYMVLNDLPFVPADIEQAKKRIHRIGQERTCFYYYMFLSPIHEKIYKTVLKKVEAIKQLD